jgi:hypothetical protein
VEFSERESFTALELLGKEVSDANARDFQQMIETREFGNHSEGRDGQA